MDYFVFGYAGFLIALIITFAILAIRFIWRITERQYLRESRKLLKDAVQNDNMPKCIYDRFEQRIATGYSITKAVNAALKEWMEWHD